VTADAARLAELLRAARRAVALTGAGISVPSGIPDFRSPGTGLWADVNPMEVAHIGAFRRDPVRFWSFYGTRFATLDGKRPNRAHAALAELERRGLIQAVITQNIDGLQQEAGVAADKVIELHGNGTYATCLDCGERHELDWVRRQFEATGDAPDCRRCGGVVKSATISFGQAMPDEPMRRAQELTLACDLFLVIGSSLVVYPAAGFPLAAKNNGAALVIVNREPTELDAFADLVINAEIGDVLERFIARPLGASVTAESRA
jgi:NAD-dependent deacetylase